MSFETDRLNRELLDNILEEGGHSKSSLKMCCNDLITYDDIPEWYSNNSYIYYGYRRPYLSYKTLFKTIFKIHNETCNIWSHIVGIIMFVGLFLHFVITNYNRGISTIPIGIFLCSTIVCFTNSVIMHTFYPHSKDACTILCNLDYSGIFVLIFGGYTAFIHYEFYCYTTLQIFYYTFITLIGMLALFLICKRNIFVRSLSFLMMGATSVVPIIHRRLFIRSMDDDALNHRVDEQLVFIGSTLAISIFGIILYTLRLPERIHRDYFNIIGSSHTLFHITTIIAAYLYYVALMELFNYYQKYINCA